MSNTQVKAIEIGVGELKYLSPLELVSVEGHMTKGKFGIYQDGYSVTFKNEQGTILSIVAKKKDDWFAQMHAVQIKNPSLNKFSFETNALGDIDVIGVLN